MQKYSKWTALYGREKEIKKVKEEEEEDRQREREATIPNSSYEKHNVPSVTLYSPNTLAH